VVQRYGGALLTILFNAVLFYNHNMPCWPYTANLNAS